MDEKERIRLIRIGNELFNKGDIGKASEIFLKTSYIDGITRVADYHFFERRRPLDALPFYKKARREDKVKEIYERMFFALGKLMRNEKPRTDDNSEGKGSAGSILPPLKVSPKLKILADEILRDRKNDPGGENSEKT